MYLILPIVKQYQQLKSGYTYVATSIKRLLNIVNCGMKKRFPVGVKSGES